MPFAEINKIKIYYEERGDGFPLVLIAGFGVDHMGWSAVIDNLAENYRVILFDNRGAGQSDAPDQSYDIAAMADDIAALLDHLQIEQAYICGHSMGTSVAQQFALKYPQKSKKMILCNALPKLNTLSRMVFDIIDRMIVDGSSRDILCDFFVPWCYSDDTLANLDNHPQVKERNAYAKTTLYPQSVVGFKRQLEAVKSFDITKEAKNITVPTLLIAGDKDFLTPIEGSHYLADHIPQAELHIIKDTGHMSFVEKPKEFCEIVDTFLAEKE